jgi:hypothetical protein
VQVFDVQARRRAITLRAPRIRGLAFDPTGPRLVTLPPYGRAATIAECVTSTGAVDSPHILRPNYLS